MKFEETSLNGAFVVNVEMRNDDRGGLARTFCVREFSENGLGVNFPQCSTVYNALGGTVRGMHFQMSPRPEVKLVRCTRGRIFDVAVDLRPDSKTFLKWFGIELSAENRRAIYLPFGFAHGLQTLEDHSEVYYQISEYYEPDLAGGVRYDDPLVKVKWPLPITKINERDRAWPLIDVSTFKSLHPAGA